MSGDAGGSSSLALHPCKDDFGGGERGGDDGGVGLDRKFTGGGGIGRVIRGGGISSSAPSSLDVSCSISAIVLGAAGSFVSPCNLHSCASATAVPDAGKASASCVGAVPCSSCWATTWTESYSSGNLGEGNVCPS